MDNGTLAALITVLGTVSVAALTGLFSWVVRRQSRTVDAATIRKTEAEAVAQEVKTARELLSDMREYFNQRLSDQASEHKEEIAGINDQVRQLKDEVAQLVSQHRALVQSFAVHNRWDQTAWAKLLQTDPSYPPPPSIEGLL